MLTLPSRPWQAAAATERTRDRFVERAEPSTAALRLETWQFAPANRHAFVAVDTLLPCASIRGAGDAALPLPADALHRAEDLRLGAPDSLDRLLPRLEHLYVDGLAVLRGDELLLEYYGGELTPARRHLCWSVSKTVTGLIAGRLVADGALREDSTVASLVPALADSGWASATLSSLLDMRDAAVWNEDYGSHDEAAPAEAGPGSVAESTVRRQDRAMGLLPALAGDTPQGGRRFLATIEADARLAGTFRYRSGCTDVAAWMLEAATGRSFPALVQDRLWSRFAADEACWITDARDFALASGGLCCTLRDLTRLGVLLARGGDGVLPSEWVASLSDAAAGYRRFTWTLGEGRFEARGVHGQRLHVGPDGLVIALFSSWPDADGGAAGVDEDAVTELVEDLEGHFRGR